MEKKDSRTGAAVYMQSLGRAVWSPRNYGSFATEGYIQNAVTHRCVRLIAECAKSVCLEVHDSNGPVEKHPFLDLMARPNPYEGWSDLSDQLFSHLLIAGNVYLEAVVLGSDIAELYVLRPDRMKLVPGPSGRPKAYVYRVGNNEVTFMLPQRGQFPIMHLKNFNPTNDHYGLSSIEPASFAIDVHNAAGAYNKALLDNSAKPSGAVVVAETLTTDQYDRLKSEIAINYVGAKNAGRPLLLEGGLDWKQMGMTPTDMEFTAGKNQAAREIALAFGVPPMLLGIPGDNTYSNYAEANLSLFNQTVIPIVVKLCQALSVFLQPTYGSDFKVWFDKDQIEGLSASRDSLWGRLNASTFLKVNEKRVAAGYEEIDAGDVLLIQSSMIPLDLEMGTEEDEPTTDEPTAGDAGENLRQPDQEAEATDSEEDQQ